MYCEKPMKPWNLLEAKQLRGPLARRSNTLADYFSVIPGSSFDIQVYTQHVQDFKRGAYPAYVEVSLAGYLFANRCCVDDP